MKGSITNQLELFTNKFENYLNHNHPLYKAANLFPWELFEREIGKLYTENTGRTSIPIRLMVGLHFLKYQRNLSDRELLRNFLENQYFQYFCGYKYFVTWPPMSETTLVKFRKKLTKSHKELFLRATYEMGIKIGLITKREIENILVDTTAQEKNITYPTDAKLFFKMINKLRIMAEYCNVPLKQSYKFVSKTRLREANNKRKKKVRKKALNKLKTYLRRLLSDIVRKLSNGDFSNGVIEGCFDPLFKLAEKLLEQQKDSKNKIYSLHEPHVACIAKGKSGKRFEFGNKVSYAVTAKSTFVVSCVSYTGNPHDGKTLKDTINCIEKITEKTPKRVFVDNGYRGHDCDGDADVYLSNDKNKENVPSAKSFKRRSSIEPVFGHLKNFTRMRRNYLSGVDGDEFNAILSSAGYNFRNILNHLAKIRLGESEYSYPYH